MLNDISPGGRRLGALAVALLSAILLLTTLIFVSAPGEAAGGNCDPDVLQPNGSIYRFCLPPGWDGGGLLVYAHGYVWFDEPVAIPEDQICLGDTEPQTCINDIANDLGIAFATTSYPLNGLAVLPAVDDVVNLVDVFSDTYGTPSTTLIAGVSEGGLVTTLAVERHPQTFAGGLAACGPIGSWSGQIGYFGDFRVLFDYYFPGLLPTEVITIPQWLITAWRQDNYFENVVEPVIFDPGQAFSLTQFLAVGQVPHLPAEPDTVRQALRDGLAYNIMATNEVMEKLGGNPFDNQDRVYSGSADDETLNAEVRRFSADAAALEAMVDYETSGLLQRPLVSLHTSLDQQVPQWHETLYQEKVLFSHRWMWYLDHPVPVDNYGHCIFDADAEVLPAFFSLLGMVDSPPQPGYARLPQVAAPASPNNELSGK